MRIVKDLVQGSSEWLLFRKLGIGSSDIASIMGKSPWANPMDVWRDKAGFADYKKPNKWMKRGTQHEGYVRKLVENNTGLDFPPCCMIHSNFDYFRASLDGYNEENGYVLEIKVPGPKVMEMARWHSLPDYYNIQIQWQLFVSGSKCARYAVYDPDSNEFETWCIDRDEQLIKELETVAHNFWQEFLKGNPPEEQIMEIKDEDAVNLSHIYIRYDLLEKEYSDSKKCVKARLVDLGDDGDFKVGRLTFRRNSPRKSYDMAAMIADGIDVEKYVKNTDGIGFYTVKIEK